MVFYHHDVGYNAGKLPRYLDLSHYAEQQGIPFTFSSNLLHALYAAIKRVPWDERFAELAGHSAWLRTRLSDLGFQLIGNGAPMSPAVVTIALPQDMSSSKLGEMMQESGYLLSCNSEYLRRRNWIQICLMGESSREKLLSLLNALNRACFRRKSARIETVAIPGAAPVAE
jgi:aspartate aminotransferase-like enzyme